MVQDNSGPELHKKRMDYYGKSHVGLKRRNNEDIFLIRPDLGFILVADGMGGEAAGGLASQFFLETAVEVFSKDTGRSEQLITKMIQKTFSLANEKILSHISQNTGHKGMGCTAELLAICDGGFVLGHLGDSRTYSYRNGRLKQVTRDHSFVQNLIDRGIISPDEARTHSRRNVILRAVGVDQLPSLDLIKGKILPGDIFLLCSDGLTDLIDDGRIQSVIASQATLPRKVEALIQMANDSGGYDNITVVLLEIV